MALAIAISRLARVESIDGATQPPSMDPGLCFRMKDFIAVIAGYRAAERRNRKAAVASTAALAEMLLYVLTGWAVLLVLLQPVTACYSG